MTTGSMKWTLTVLAAALLAGTVGCDATRSTARMDRPAGDEAYSAAPGLAMTSAGTSAAPAPVAGDPMADEVVPENYDEGIIFGPGARANPFWYLGQASEKSGYPYQGQRVGCDLLYFPSINYCKYFDHPERLIRIDRVFEVDAQGFTDDWDLFWQADRPTYLNRYYAR